MCRNIRRLHNFEPPATHDEIESAALQVVRKVGVPSKPSMANEAAYAIAVSEITATTERLLRALTTSAAPLDREEFAAAARARAAKRYA